jgi:hypothetical protein
VLLLRIVIRSKFLHQFKVQKNPNENPFLSWLWAGEISARFLIQIWGLAVL